MIAWSPSRPGETASSSGPTRRPSRLTGGSSWSPTWIPSTGANYHHSRRGNRAALERQNGNDEPRYLAASDRYDSMIYRRCGRSGLLLPAVSLGLWQNFGDDRTLDSSAPSCDALSISGLPISTWPTTTVPLTAVPRRTSVASFAQTSASTAMSS